MNREELRNQFQAEVRIVRNSTIERKQMSTKTTFKRIALVSVAALGLGVFASAPSNAAPTIAYTVIADAANGQAIVGGLAKVTITFDTMTTTNVVVSGVGNVVAVGAHDSVTVVGTVTTGSWSATEINDSGQAVAAGSQLVTLYSAVAGVTTITATPISASTGAPGTAVTKTVTWVAATSTGTYDHSTAFIDNVVGGTSRIYADDTTNVDASSTYGANSLWTINVTQFNAADTVTATTLPAGKAITATITGAGSIGATTAGTDRGPSVTVAAPTSEDYLYVFADGRNGAATITISVNGAVVATKTVSFYGTVASYGVATDGDLSRDAIGVFATSASGADAESATVTIAGFDALSTEMASGTIYATTDDAKVASVVVAGSVVYVYGVALGSTNVNVCNTSACTSATIKYSFPITVTGKTAASYKLAFDAATYDPGALVTWTVTATTAEGSAIADGARAVIGTTVTNLAVANGTVPSGALTFTGGVATGTFFAPATTGLLTLTTVEGAASNNVALGGTAAKTATSITVVNAGVDAATDAANEATDAANAATDAALAAADSADAATEAAQEASDAVAELSTQVAALMASLKAQIKSLTNLVIKIQKKLKK